MRVRRSDALAALLPVTGTTHFLSPRVYARIVPRWLGNPIHRVTSAGACAETGVRGRPDVAADARDSRLGGSCAFVVVFPANVQERSTRGCGPAGIAPRQTPFAAAAAVVWWAVPSPVQARM